MSIVQDFGGMRVKDGKVILNPFIPDHWPLYSFKLMFRNALLKITVTKDDIIVKNESEKVTTVIILNNEYTLKANDIITVNQ